MTKFHVYMNKSQNLASWMVDNELVAVAVRLGFPGQWLVSHGEETTYQDTMQESMKWVYTEIVKSEVTDAATQ